jgi:hypothetical protein
LTNEKFSALYRWIGVAGEQQKFLEKGKSKIILNLYERSYGAPLASQDQ